MERQNPATLDDVVAELQLLRGHVVPNRTREAPYGKCDLTSAQDSPLARLRPRQWFAVFRHGLFRDAKPMTRDDALWTIVGAGSAKQVGEVTTTR